MATDFSFSNVSVPQELIETFSYDKVAPNIPLLTEKQWQNVLSGSFFMADYVENKINRNKTLSQDTIDSLRKNYKSVLSTIDQCKSIMDIIDEGKIDLASLSDITVPTSDCLYYFSDILSKGIKSLKSKVPFTQDYIYKNFSIISMIEEFFSLERDYANFKISYGSASPDYIFGRIIVLQGDTPPVNIAYQNAVYPIGPLTIKACIDHRFFTAPEIRRASNNKIPSPTGRTNIHPHVHSAGRLCCGAGIDSLNSAFSQLRFYDAFSIIHQILQTYNPGSPYLTIDYFKGPNTICKTCFATDVKTTCSICTSPCCVNCMTSVMAENDQKVIYETPVCEECYNNSKKCVICETRYVGAGITHCHNCRRQNKVAAPTSSAQVFGKQNIPMDYDGEIFTEEVVAITDSIFGDD